MDRICKNCKFSSDDADTGMMCQNPKNSEDEYYEFIKPWVDEDDSCEYWEELK